MLLVVVKSGGDGQKVGYQVTVTTLQQCVAKRKEKGIKEGEKNRTHRPNRIHLVIFQVARRKCAKKCGKRVEVFERYGKTEWPTS
jgi:hypothetical protein